MKKKYNILLVEDDEDDYYTFNFLISSLPGNHELLRTENGIMFSSLMEASTPDIIFMDINLPYKSGLELLKEIRSNASFDAVKVIMYSTSSNKRDIDFCYEHRADFFIVKPPSLSKGKQQIQQLFENENFRNHSRVPRSEFVIDIPKTPELIKSTIAA